MLEITLRHDIDCDEDTYWTKCVFDEEYNRRLYLEKLKFTGFKTLEQRDEGDQLYRKVLIDLPLDGIPKPAKKLIGDRLSYMEDGVFNRATKRYTFTVTPTALGDKTKTTGSLHCEPRDGNKIVRVAYIKAEVKIFAIGGIIEEKIVGDLKQSYALSQDFTQQFLKEKGL